MTAQEEPAKSDDTIRLDYLEQTARNHIFSIGDSWYSRSAYGQPYKKHKTLRKAIDYAIQVYPK